MRHAVLALFVIACGGSDPPGPIDAPQLTGEMFRLTYGPVTIAPGKEGTRCIWLRLPNTTEIKVHQVRNVLSSSSHHLIVYKDDMDTTEQTTPVDCEPFTGALNTTGAIAPTHRGRVASFSSTPVYSERIDRL